MSGTQQDITTLPVMVTLTIGRWNVVLEILGKRKWNLANPLIVDIHRQIQDAVDAQGTLGRSGDTVQNLRPVS